MSVIWRAHDEMLDRLVAIKVLASSLATDARFCEWARAEARAAAALDHPSVTAVYDYGETIDDAGGVAPYVVMELLSGEPLSARLTAGPLAWREAVEICVAVAGALAAAHRRGVVHRDITPDNIMLTGAGVKVLDFGIATTIGAPDEDEDGATFGTPAYVAPERLDGHKARPETDTYALGVVMYEMLTGHPPYQVDTWEDLAALDRGDQPRPTGVPGLPAAVADLVRRCLSADPWQRPAASQLVRQLRRHLPGAARRFRRRALVLASTATALAVGLFLGAVVLTPSSPPQATPPTAATTPPPVRVLDAPPTPVATPTVGPAAPPPSPAAVPVAEVTFDTIYQLIEHGRTNNQIREDVAHDLRQLVDNLRLEVARGSADLPTEMAALRDKVLVRASEGSVSPESARALNSALAQLAET